MLPKIFFKSGRHILFFKTAHKDCKIDSLANIILQAKRGIFSIPKNEYTIIDEYKATFSEFLIKKFRKQSKISKIIVFGNYIVTINEENEVELIKGIESIHHNSFIEPNWFDNCNDDVIIILFGANGQYFFEDNNSEWAKKFKNWISFKKNFSLLDGIPEFGELVSNLYEDIFEVIFSSKDIVEITKNIKKVYEKYLPLFTKAGDDQNAFEIIQNIHCNICNIKCSLN